jgi:CubicO group peptidase (beta-lactamase class C family)
MNKILLFSSALLFWTTPIWGQSTFHPQSMEDAADYSKDAGGATTLIMQDGKIIFEDYHNGADSLTVTHLFSGTKGFWSIMAAHALETGLISSYDERVASTITEWVSSPRHQGKGLITIKHLLELSSGLSNDVDQIQGTKPGAANIYQYVVDSVRLTSYPGNTFNYGPVNYYVFGVLLERKLASRGIFMNPLEYLDSIILSPIGFEYDSWVHDSSGKSSPAQRVFCNITQLDKIWPTPAAKWSLARATTR